MDLKRIQESLKREKLDGWLFFDHHVRDALAYRVLGVTPAAHVSRRWYYFIPANGEPRGMVHRIESKMLDAAPGEKIYYSSWREQQDGLAKLLAGARRVAMQYSPRCAIPYVAMVDAGTVELVRECGVEVLSSAELIQEFESCLTDEQYESHMEAGRRVDRVRAGAFQFMADRLASGVNEVMVRDWVLDEFRKAGLVTESGPIVGVNAHAGDPHYEPTPKTNVPIKARDFVLLDMWARVDQPGSVYYDITWTGFCGAPTERVSQVFGIVRDARDKAVDTVVSAVAAGREIRGFEVDDAARGHIQAEGFGEQFVHRTGHSIGESVHGSGANMDNMETHDERRIMPGSLFSVEPGIYLDDFGVRAEVNVYLGVRDGKLFAGTTGEVQRELVRIGS